MRLAYWIIGTLGVAGGIGLIAAATFAMVPHPPEDAYAIGAIFALGGAVHLVAAEKNYRGHGSFLVGVVLLVLGSCPLAMIDSPADRIPSFICASLLLPLGLVSLRSGHKLHRCTVGLETLASGTVALQKDQLLAAIRNSRGLWSFVVGVALLVLCLYPLSKIEPGLDRSLKALGWCYAGLLLALGLLSFRSGDKLNRCRVELERLAARTRPVPGKDQAVCVECGDVFELQDMMAHGSYHICARCKPIFLQKLAEGARVTPSVIHANS